MELKIVVEGFELEQAVHEQIERRFHELGARFGPITKVRVVVSKTRWLGELTAGAELVLPPTWTIRPRSKARMDGLQNALDEMFLKAVALMRRVAWVRDGVPDPCRWCRGESFVYVQHPADATDAPTSPQPMQLVCVDDKWYGALETLVCRECGHVEWFVRDPQALPVGPGPDGIITITTRASSPYRG